ncbi:hypothetical protein, partial [Massilia agri]
EATPQFTLTQQQTVTAPKKSPHKAGSGKAVFFYGPAAADAAQNLLFLLNFGQQSFLYCHHVRRKDAI